MLLVSAGAELGWKLLPAREQTGVFSVVEEISRPLLSSAPASIPAAPRPRTIRCSLYW
jgi:hypothetical protein